MFRKLHPRSIRASYVTIQVSSCSSHLHTGRISAQSRSKDYILISINVISQHHSGLEGWISDPSRSHFIAIQVVEFCLTSIQVLHHPHSSPKILESPPSMYCLNFILVQIFMSHLHQCHVQPGHNIRISPQSRSSLASIQVMIIESHIPLVPLQPTGPYICVAPLSWRCLTSIQVHKFASQFVRKIASETHPASILDPCRFQDVHLPSIQV